MPTHLFGLGFGVNVEAVEARHGQSAAMPCPEISFFLLFFASIRMIRTVFHMSSLHHSFFFISEGGGLRVNRRACISCFSVIA